MLPGASAGNPAPGDSQRCGEDGHYCPACKQLVRDLQNLGPPPASEHSEAQQNHLQPTSEEFLRRRIASALEGMAGARWPMLGGRPSEQLAAQAVVLLRLSSLVRGFN